MSLDIEKATTLIIEQSKELVNQIIEKRGHSNPPFLPHEYSSFLNIKEIIKVDLKNTSAFMTKSEDGYVIKLNKYHNSARRNFSCAHEFGHIIFNDLKLEQYIKNIEYRKFNPQGTQRVQSAAKERLCDIAAKELLMPEQIFKKYLKNFGVSIRTIEWLAELFKVSIQSTSIRITEVNLEPCIAIKWQPWPKDKPNSLKLVWRAGTGINTKNKTNYMPIYADAKLDSILYKTYQSNDTTKSIKDFLIDNVQKSLHLESKGFGSGENRYVLSLAFLNS